VYVKLFPGDDMKTYVERIRELQEDNDLSQKDMQHFSIPLNRFILVMKKALMKFQSGILFHWRDTIALAAIIF
jgi:hypothetical protein